MKRGISPLIATVLIIGFVVGVAAVIMTWGQTFVKSLQERTEEQTVQFQKCSPSQVIFDIKNACLIGHTIKFTIDNRGSEAINYFIVRKEGEKGSETSRTSNGLAGLGIANIEAPYSYEFGEIVKSVELLPAIKVEDREVAGRSFEGGEVVCSNIQVKKENLADCVDDDALFNLSFDNIDVNNLPIGIDMAGEVSLVPGILGQGVEVKESGHLGYPLSPENLNKNQGTIEFWVKLNRLPENNAAVVFDTRNDAANVLKNELALSFLEAQTFGLPASLGVILANADETYDGSAPAIVATLVDDWNAGEWHHIAVVWDLNAPVKGANVDTKSRLDLYVDGSNLYNTLESNDDQDAINNIAVERFGDKIYLGSGVQLEGYDLLPLDGVIDEFRIYDYPKLF